MTEHLLQRSHVLIQSFLREGFSTACGRSLGALFVQPRLALVLRSYELKFDPPEPREFEHQMREQEAGRLANDLRDLAYLIQSFKVKDGIPQMLSHTTFLNSPTIYTVRGFPASMTPCFTESAVAGARKEPG